MLAGTVLVLVAAGAWTQEPPGPTPRAGIASKYVADQGIEHDPDVIWVERFDGPDLETIFRRYTEVRNGAGMRLVPDVPAGSRVPHALRITALGGENTGGHLYRPLPETADELYVRFYVKYGPTGTHHHSGLGTGGYNPPTRWSQGHAGRRPTGDDRFTLRLEGDGTRMNIYTYWMGMRGNPTSIPATGENYWGNLLVNDVRAGVAADEWICYEMRVRLNDPVTGSNGELSLWRNGERIFDMGPGTTGDWVWDRFTRNVTGEPFEGFRWRTTDDLRLGFVSLALYATRNPPGVESTIQFAHVVVARSYIGPLRAD